MPTYCYRVEGTDEIVEEIMSFAEKAERDVGGEIVLCDGRKAYRDITAEQCATHGSDNWPIYSDAAAVSPEQIGEATEHARRSGVPTNYDSKGRPVLTSPKHRRAYLRSRGMYDQDGYE